MINVAKNVKVQEVEYYNLVGKPESNEKTLMRKMQRFFDENPIIETDDMFIDVRNILNRKFACNRGCCDLRITSKKAKKGLFTQVETQDDHIYDRCCCEGGSYPIPDELIKNIDDNLDEIIKVLPQENQDIIKKSGYLVSKRYKGVKRRKTDDMCIMAYECDDMMYCALHSFALNVGKDILDFKPYDCSIFPMDYIYVNGKILLTTISNFGETAEILRWGTPHLQQSCLHKNEGEPMYQYSKDGIIKVVGEDNWNVINDIFNNYEWQKLL